MGPAFLIAEKDLRQRVRDRSAIAIGLVAPIVIAALMSFAFRGAENIHFTLAVADEDHTALSAGLLESLRQPGLRQFVTLRQVRDGRAAVAAVRDRRAQAGLVVPVGFAAGVVGAHPVALRTLTSVNNTIVGSVVHALSASFVAQLNADRLSVGTAIAAGAPSSELTRLESLAAHLQLPERVVQRPLGARELTVISYYSPAMALFFLLFTISFTARSFFVDRSQGMVERMRAAPVRPLEIVAGKSLSVFVFGAVSLAVIVLVTSVLFGARWGSPAAVAVVCLAMVLSVVSLTALVIGIARTQRQAEGIASAVVFGLALLGGNFVLVSQSPLLMRRLALATPNGWALRAFTDLSTTGGGLSVVVTPVLAMVGFALAAGAVAALLARRAVSS